MSNTKPNFRNPTCSCRCCLAQVPGPVVSFDFHITPPIEIGDDPPTGFIGSGIQPLSYQAPELCHTRIRLRYPYCDFRLMRIVDVLRKPLIPKYQSIAHRSSPKVLKANVREDVEKQQLCTRSNLFGRSLMRKRDLPARDQTSNAKPQASAHAGTSALGQRRSLCRQL